MDKDLIFMLVTYLNRITPLIISTGVLIIGILITSNKVRSTRMLGISFIFSAINQFIAGLFKILSVHILKESEISSILMPYNILIYILAGLSTLFLCFFIHKNYRKKLIYLPMFIIPVVSWFIDRFVTLLIVPMHLVDQTGILITMISNIIFFITSAVISVILIIIFLKNRKNEKVIPLAWLFRTIMLGWGFMYTVLMTFVYLQMIYAGTTVGGTDYLMLDTASSASNIVFPIYVVISVFEASKKTEPDEGSYVSTI